MSGHVMFRSIQFYLVQIYLALVFPNISEISVAQEIQPCRSPIYPGLSFSNGCRIAILVNIDITLSISRLLIYRMSEITFPIVCGWTLSVVSPRGDTATHSSCKGGGWFAQESSDVVGVAGETGLVFGGKGGWRWWWTFRGPRQAYSLLQCCSDSDLVFCRNFPQILATIVILCIL